MVFELRRRAGLPSIAAERQSHYVKEFIFLCRVLIERKKLQLEAPLLQTSSDGDSFKAVSLNPKEQEQQLELNELRLPLLLQRDDLGVFRDR